MYPESVIGAAEERVALVHRVLVPDVDYPKEFAVLVSSRRSIFISQPKSRSDFWLRGEMRWGTALVTDVAPKRLEDYDGVDLDQLSRQPGNFEVPHDAVVSLAMKSERPAFRPFEFWVKWTMERQKEVFQVYNFEMTYRVASGEMGQIKFYSVPLGEYFKPRRQTKTREVILREYADEILGVFRGVLPPKAIQTWSQDTQAALQ